MYYDLIGAKWGAPTNGTTSGTVTYSYDLSGLSIADSSTVSDFQNALDQAFLDWEQAASVDFAFTSAGDTAADIFIDMGALSNNIAGQTLLSYVPHSGVDTIFDADIILDSSMRSWSPDGSVGTDFYAVALHEIGHAIGLDHVNDPSEIMNPVISTDHLGIGDVAGAQAIYGADIGDTPASSSAAAAPSSGGASASGGGGGGGAGAGVLLLLSGIVALLASLFGGGAGVAVTMLAGRTGDDENGTGDDQHDHPDMAAGADLMAFLNDALGDKAAGFEELHELRMEDLGDPHSAEATV